jgi:hypothetical protein
MTHTIRQHHQARKIIPRKVGARLAPPPLWEGVEEVTGVERVR